MDEPAAGVTEPGQPGDLAARMLALHDELDALRDVGRRRRFLGLTEAGFWRLIEVTHWILTVLFAALAVVLATLGVRELLLLALPVPAAVMALVGRTQAIEARAIESKRADLLSRIAVLEATRANTALPEGGHDQP